MKIVADTGALISLKFSSLYEVCIRYFDIIIGYKIEKELREIADKRDRLGKAAKSLLKDRRIIRLKFKKKFKKGELEAEIIFKILKADLLISDDIDFINKERTKNPRIAFSIILIFLLYQARIISKTKAKLHINRIFKSRKWKENLIIQTAKELLD